MNFKIETERKILPPRIVLYGPEGVGKTTFGASLPNPFFICSEGGADHFALPKVSVKDLKTLLEVFNYLRDNIDTFGSIIIDSIDWLEDFIGIGLAKNQGKQFLEDIPWGKGPEELKKEMREVLSYLDYFQKQKKMVCLIAHSEVKKQNDPDLPEGYDRYTLKCNKKTTPLYKEWSDCLFFVNFHKDIINGKAIGNGKRVVFANHSAALDAKNRYSIPDGLELDFKNFIIYFNK